MKAPRSYNHKDYIENQDYRAAATKVMECFDGEPHWTSLVMWIVENRDENGMFNVDELINKN